MKNIAELYEKKKEMQALRKFLREILDPDESEDEFRVDDARKIISLCGEIAKCSPEELAQASITVYFDYTEEYMFLRKVNFLRK